LDNNKLKRIESNTFKGLINLEELSLFDNQIEEINVNGLVDLKNLKELYLDNNKLKRIDRSCFEPLTSIAIISLRGNELASKANCFFNETLAVKYGWNVEEYKKYVNSGFKSNREEFLKQFLSGDFVYIFLNTVDTVKFLDTVKIYLETQRKTQALLDVLKKTHIPDKY